MNNPSQNKRPHVVIIGAGFGGIKAAQSLADAPVDVTLIDRHNYHLFQPLLYQVATAGLAPDDVAKPVRAILRGQKNLIFCMAEVQGIDWDHKVVKTDSRDFSYDYLILAVGGETNHFGMKNVAEKSFGLKTVNEAIEIRNHILSMFELAEHERDLEKRRAMLTFAIVGGGPTGVECAGALSELVHHVLVKEYTNVNFKEVRIMLIQAVDHLLPGMPADLSEVTAKILWDKKVDVRFAAQVIDVEGDKILLKGGEVIPSRTLIWAAGIRSAALLDQLTIEQGAQKRAVVNEKLQIPGHEEAFVIGDAAAFIQDGAPLPTIATVAIQQGVVVAANIKNLLADRELITFRYKDPGTMATIGRNAAVVKIGNFKTSGFFAWFLWLFVHIMALMGFRNRVFVFFKWAWDYVFYDRAVRIITKT
ncbi:MAG: NAD(P)/FAD-dependent oxidoreductase [Sporomusaceae bacterium]|nr:NAD(P)/FAD-dependent oxidoreductase [Sporomusaceae bacterium]